MQIHPISVDLFIYSIQPMAESLKDMVVWYFFATVPNTVPNTHLN